MIKKMITVFLMLFIMGCETGLEPNIDNFIKTESEPNINNFTETEYKIKYEIISKSSMLSFYSIQKNGETEFSGWKESPYEKEIMVKGYFYERIVLTSCGYNQTINIYINDELFLNESGLEPIDIIIEI
jgi:hypothetical protein